MNGANEWVCLGVVCAFDAYLLFAAATACGTCPLMHIRNGADEELHWRPHLVSELAGEMDDDHQSLLWSPQPSRGLHNSTPSNRAPDRSSGSLDDWDEDILFEQPQQSLGPFSNQDLCPAGRTHNATPQATFGQAEPPIRTLTYPIARAVGSSA